ncbi:NADP oxidoreductase [Thiomicrorhabdus indica]|uniref:NADP oxidoreductase n=1 Tax=Thiomicrorhabdus indica TaxID=2267253 RepID=UPI00102DAD54|nr:NADP oxidoreductase [Thiomicrorhabdus indica]
MTAVLAKIQSNQQLTPQADKDIFSIELVPLNETHAFDYQPGDWALVSGLNPDSLVEKVLALLKIDSKAEVELKRFGNLPAGKALVESLEITQLNPAILNKLQRQFQIGLDRWSDRAAMMDYAQGKDVVDLLEDIPEIQRLGADFLQLLSPLAPRYYSIASANTHDVASSLSPLRLLYRRVEYQSSGRTRLGVVSNWLANQPAGKVLTIDIKSNPTFKLPAGKDSPIIMIASGTGLAPFLGFMEQRVANQATDNWLFFGETDPEKTCLHCEKLNAWKNKGFLNVDFAFSRVEPKAYVQDVLKQNADKVWESWQQGALVYLCGSQDKMAVAVQALWQEWFAEKLNLTETEAENYWQQMRREKRIQMDVY